MKRNKIKVPGDVSILQGLLFYFIILFISKRNMPFRKYTSNQSDHASGCSNRYSSCKHKHR